MLSLSMIHISFMNDFNDNNCFCINICNWRIFIFKEKVLPWLSNTDISFATSSSDIPSLRIFANSAFLASSEIDNQLKIKILILCIQYNFQLYSQIFNCRVKVSFIITYQVIQLLQDQVQILQCMNENRMNTCLK